MRGKRFFTVRTISNIIVLVVGILLYMALANITAIRDILGWLIGILSPFVIAIAIAYLLNLPVRFVENRLFSKLRFKRSLSVLVVFVAAILLLALLTGLILPQLVQSVVTLVRNIPSYLNNLNELVLWTNNTFGLDSEILDFLVLSYTDIINQLMVWIRDAFPNLLNWTMQLGSGLVGVLTAIIASIYMLVSKEKLLAQMKRLIYAVFPIKWSTRVMRISSLSNKMFSGFIGGKIVDSLIIGLICFLFMTIVDGFFIEMPFALLISVIIGVTNIIPFFGPFIGAIPSVMILLMVNPWSAVWFTIFIIVLQQFDGNILGPKILGDSTGLPALWVLVAIIVGGGLFGFMGMLLGVPTMAVLYTVTSELVASSLRKKNLTHLYEGDGRDDTVAGGPPEAAETAPLAQSAEKEEPHE